MVDVTSLHESELRSRGEVLREALVGAGVQLVVGFVTNGSNLVHAKSMPVARTADFVAAGAGMSPVYSGYSVDGTIQPTRHYGAVGDLRLRLDSQSVRVLADGLALGPVDVVTQAGEVDPSSARAILERVCRGLASDRIDATLGHELEFVLVSPDGAALPKGYWTPYGLGPIRERQAFLTELAVACADADVPLEQLHAEYGREQFEISLPPAGPVAAGDAVVVVKAIVAQVAERHGVAASFSPVPFPGAVGSGAHQHFSLSRDGVSLFSDGARPDGLHDVGANAVAGLLAHLKEAQGVLTGSVLSGSRLLPGMWSGACICWGTENREASVRLVRAGPASPHGASVEVKVIDPSANPYLASATILGLAHHGIREQLTLTPEMTEDPSLLSAQERAAAGIDVLEQDPGVMLDRLESSTLMRHILGEAAVEALLAVRRHEREVFDGPPETVAEALRLAWSV